MSGKAGFVTVGRADPPESHDLLAQALRQPVAAIDISRPASRTG